MEECFPERLLSRYITQIVLRKAAGLMASIMEWESP
jgi:hypothetical protein